MPGSHQSSLLNGSQIVSELVSQWVGDKHNQWSDSGPIINERKRTKRTRVNRHTQEENSYLRFSPHWHFLVLVAWVAFAILPACKGNVSFWSKMFVSLDPKINWFKWTFAFQSWLRPQHRRISLSLNRWVSFPNTILKILCRNHSIVCKLLGDAKRHEQIHFTSKHLTFN